MKTETTRRYIVWCNEQGNTYVCDLVSDSSHKTPDWFVIVQPVDNPLMFAAKWRSLLNLWP